MNVGIVLAGGLGSRMGTDTPKQFLEISGKPVIIYSLEAFEENSRTDAVCIVCIKDKIPFLDSLLKKHNIKKVKWIAEAGNTRPESVYNALNIIKDDIGDNDCVLIHDSARPLVSQRIIDENIDSAREYGACNTVIPAKDTVLKSIDGNTVDSVPLRKELYLAQTPQSFRYSIIKASYDAYFSLSPENRPEITDDCGQALNCGFDVRLVKGDIKNIKLTTPEDRAVIEAFIGSSDK